MPVCDAAKVGRERQISSGSDGDTSLTVAQMDPILARLEARFEKLRLGLLAEHQGKWALLVYRGSRYIPLLEVWDDEWDAIRAGYADQDLRRFCVKQIVESDAELAAYQSGASH